uniref:CUB domain-containing protein n=1 Tax=Rhodnius prolixus TaxID=13249 RepID=T1I9Z4_RHOPR
MGGGLWPGKYRTDGIKIPGAMCEYQFPTNNHSTTRGRFYSPFYPSSYTKNSKCVYRFKASGVLGVYVFLAVLCP